MAHTRETMENLTLRIAGWTLALCIALVAGPSLPGIWGMVAAISAMAAVLAVTVSGVRRHPSPSMRELTPGENTRAIAYIERKSRILKARRMRRSNSPSDR